MPRTASGFTLRGSGSWPSCFPLPTTASSPSWTWALSRAILERYPRSTAILADFSDQMMGAGARDLQPFADRYRYVTFDMSASDWPAGIPGTLDAIVSSLFVHHLPGERKRTL